MRNFFLSTLMILSVSFIMNAQLINPNYVDGEIYLNVDDTCSNEITLLSADFPGLSLIFTNYEALQLTRPFVGISASLTQTYRVKINQINNIDNFITDLELLPYVNFAEKVPLYFTSAVPNDLHVNQWYLTKINAPMAWDYSIGNETIKIAIVDNAVSVNHQDLIDAIAINTGEIPNNGLDDDFNGYIDDYKGYDVAENDNNPSPPPASLSNSPWVHGTHCAGIASSSTNNGIGMAGIGYNCSIIPVKCTPNSSEGNTLNSAYEGIAYAMRAGANVISMSFGGGPNVVSNTGQSIINAAYLQGITLVAAAGNNDSNDSFYPAAFPQVISVGATDALDSKAFFSNYGSTVDVMAPGVSIYSTLSDASNSQYGNLSGTSMACPLTAGLCGLIISQNPTRTPSEVRNILQSGCDNIDSQNPTYIGQLGAGRINAYNSLFDNALEIPESSIASLMSKNPFEESIKISCAVNSTIEIYSILGMLLNRYDVSESQTIEIGNTYSSGTYIISVINGSLKENIKVIKL